MPPTPPLGEGLKLGVTTWPMTSEKSVAGWYTLITLGFPGLGTSVRPALLTGIITDAAHGQLRSASASFGIQHGKSFEMFILSTKT
jgi:hypothetical protein